VNLLNTVTFRQGIRCQLVSIYKIYKELFKKA
jgi:hypothetical protein